MSALSKIDALTAIAKGKLVGFVVDGTENVIDKSWSIEQILSCENDLYIKIETLSIAGVEFPKPLTLDEIQEGQDVYTFNTHGLTVYISEFGKMTTAALIESINCGFAQRDAESAKLQLKALCVSLGREVSKEINTVRLGNEPKKQRQKTTQTKQPEQTKTAEEKPPEISLETELQLHLDGLRSCNNAKEVESTLYEVDKVGFSAEQMLEITMLKEKKLADFELKPKPSFEDLAEQEYQRVLNELLDAAKKASTPKEANALYKYTSHWTEEQRKPLIDAVHQRLAELNPPEKSQSSLMVRIQESTNLIELAKLEEEISKCDPAIQERLTSYANQRRTYLVDSTELPWETT